MLTCNLGEEYCIHLWWIKNKTDGSSLWPTN